MDAGPNRVGSSPGPDLDVAGAAVCDRLAEVFGIPRRAREPVAGICPVGIEVEVPWRSYFPGLVQRYGLERRRVQDLNDIETASLSSDCSELEAVLLPRLQATIDCGVPRGSDRYWEFAFQPVFDISLTLEQVRQLTAAGLLPRDRKQSLHVTLGGIPRCKSVYFLCMLLEARYVDAARLRAGADKGLHPTNNWGRKGLAGVFEKGQSELVGGSKVACELRMLQLPTEDADFEDLMRTVREAADGIADHLAGQASEAAARWRAFQAEAEAVLARQGLPLNNWWRGGPDGGVNLDAWNRFADALVEVRCSLAGWYSQRHAAERKIRERMVA